MADREVVNFKADTRQLRELFAALKEMGDEANTSLKIQTTAISAWTATQLKMAAYSPEGEGAGFAGQSIRLAETIRANKDKVPNVTIGGSKVKFSGGAVSGEVLFGNEFGAKNRTQDKRRGARGFANGGQRFPDRSPREGRGNRGYWIFPTLKTIQPDITRKWTQAVEQVLEAWGK